MPQWTLLGLLQGKQTAPWPLAEGTTARTAFSACRATSRSCAATVARPAPTSVRPRRSPCASTGAGGRLDVDYGRCVVCQLCTEACPTGAMARRPTGRSVSRTRDDLIWNESEATAPVTGAQTRRAFRRSLHIRHVDAGSCNGCESELQALNNPFYNLHRLGIFFTASPRFADLLLVTGPVTNAMLGPLRATYEAMAEPRWVLAVGTCAVSGGIAEGGYACGHGLDGVIPVDVYLPGCPPNPAAIIQALLMFLDRAPQRVKGGQLVE